MGSGPPAGLELALLLVSPLSLSPSSGLQTGAEEVSGFSWSPGGAEEAAEQSLSSEYFLERREASSSLPCSVLMLLLVSSGFFLVERSSTVSPLLDGPG